MLRVLHFTRMVPESNPSCILTVVSPIGKFYVRHPRDLSPVLQNSPSLSCAKYWFLKYTWDEGQWKGRMQNGLKVERVNTHSAPWGGHWKVFLAMGRQSGVLILRPETWEIIARYRKQIWESVEDKLYSLNFRYFQPLVCNNLLLSEAGEDAK